MDCPIRMFPPVPLATAPTPEGSAKCLASQASSIGTWSAPLSIWSSGATRGGRQDISWIMRPTVADLTRNRCRRSPNMSARSGKIVAFCCVNRAEFIHARATEDHEALPVRKWRPLRFPSPQLDRFWQMICRFAIVLGVMERVRAGLLQCADYPSGWAEIRYLVNQL